MVEYVGYKYMVASLIPICFAHFSRVFNENFVKNLRESMSGDNGLCLAHH